MRASVGLTALGMTLFAGSAAAHFNMLLPQAASAKKGESVRVTYQWGHPFEHQLFDAPRPLSLIVLDPDGKRSDLTARLEKTARKAGPGEVTAYTLRFVPEERGDYVFVLTTPPIWMEEDGEFLQDTVKTFLHVQAQKGWDRPGAAGELEPLTRPYGLLPGMVFQAQLRPWPSAARDALVEVERHNAAPPPRLPPDEHITRTVRFDPAGVATTTLTDPGWWCLTVTTRLSTHRHEGKERRLRTRSTLWVYVDEPARRP